MSHLSYWRDRERGEGGVVLVDVPVGEDPTDVAETLYQENHQHFVHASVVVVRCVGGSLTVDSLERFRRRAPKSRLHILSIAGNQPTLSPNLNPSAAAGPEAILEADLVNELRQQELLQFVKASSALFNSGGRFVYRSPSGHYTETFLRVGSIQTSHQRLDALAFWLMPHLAGIGGVLIDTWSISSLTLNALRLQASRAEPTEEPIAFEMLAGYQDGSVEADRQALEALRRVSGGGARRCLILISTVMSGASLNRVWRHIDAAGLDRRLFTVLAVYRLGSDPRVPCLCDLSTALTDVRFGATTDDPAGRTVVEIDPHSYFPLHITEELIDFKTRDIEEQIRAHKDFFRRYRGVRSVALHRDSHELNGLPTRHHAFYVDVEQMMTAEVFLERLHGELRELASVPRLVVYPPHRASEQLAFAAKTFLERRFGVTIPSVCSRELDPTAAEFPRAALQAMTVDDEIMVVDAVSVTGRQLVTFQTNLRNYFKGRLVYLVGVARTDSVAAWEKRRRNLSYRSSGARNLVIALERLVIPNWGKDDCPWCWEETILESIAWPDDAQPAIRKRRRHLSDARHSNGLFEDAVWRLRRGGPPFLGPNSVFVIADDSYTPSDAEVVVAVAGGLQLHRKKPGGLGLSYPLLTIVPPGEYLSHTFTDALLKIAFVRVARIRELVHWKDEAERQRRATLKGLLLGRDVPLPVDDRTSLLLEYALAILAGKLPKLRFEADEWAQIASLDPLVAALLRPGVEVASG